MTTLSAPRVTTPARTLLLVGGVLLAAHGLVAVLASLVPDSPAGLIGPVLESAAVVLFAIGRLGGRSMLARIALVAVALAYAILIAAVLLAATGAGIDLLFPLGGTLLTLALLVAGIEIARVGEVGGYARWGYLAIGLWSLFIGVITAAGADLGPLVTADGPGVAGELIGNALILAEGVAVIVASRSAALAAVPR